MDVPHWWRRAGVIAEELKKGLFPIHRGSVSTVLSSVVSLGGLLAACRVILLAAFLLLTVAAVGVSRGVLLVPAGGVLGELLALTIEFSLHGLILLP